MTTKRPSKTIIIVSTLLFLCLSIKFFLLIEQTKPIFSGQDMQISFTDSQVHDDFEIHRQREVLHVSFTNIHPSQMSLTVSPNQSWEVDVNGEKHAIQNQSSQLKITIPPRERGKSYVVIARNIPKKNLINTIFIVVLLGTAVFFASSKLPTTIPIAMLLIFIIIYIFAYCLQFIDIITQPFNIQQAKQQYNNSQYVTANEPKYLIDDELVYALSGYYYIMEKIDITAINFEHPPLGKYLYGLSISLFKNARIGSLILFLTTAIIFFATCQKMIQNTLLSMIALTIFTTENLLLSLVKTSLLDLPLLLFLLISFFAYHQAVTKNAKWFLIMGLGLGAAATSKMYFPALLMGAAIFINTLINHKKLLLPMTITLSIIPACIMLAYIPYIVTHSFSELIQFLKYQLSWYQGKISEKHGIDMLMTLITGTQTMKLAKEPARIITFSHWSPTWPLVLLAVPIKLLSELKNKNLSLLTVWVIGYLIMLGINQAFSQQLFIILLPFLVMNTIVVIKDQTT